MQNSVQSILKKITYIEAEIEIQKQILYSIPDDQRGDIEGVLKTIKQAKDDIQQLRNQIAEISPQEHQKLLAIEKAVTLFKEIASKKQFTKIESMSSHPDCSITLKNGEKLPCLARACDADGNWTIITDNGEIRHLSATEVIDPG